MKSLSYVLHYSNIKSPLIRDVKPCHKTVNTYVWVRTRILNVSTALSFLSTSNRILRNVNLIQIRNISLYAKFSFKFLGLSHFTFNTSLINPRLLCLLRVLWPLTQVLLEARQIYFFEFLHTIQNWDLNLKHFFKKVKENCFLNTKSCKSLQFIRHI